MAESSGEKSEEATPKKLRDAKKKGQVSSSKDIPPAFIMLVGALYFWLAGSWLLEKLVELFILIPSLQVLPFPQAVGATSDIMVKLVVGAILLPFITMLTVTALLSNILQFGFIFAFDPVMPKLEKISFTSGFKKIFSIKQLIDTVFSLVKTILIALALIYVIRSGISELIHDIKQCDVLCQVEIVSDLFMTLLMIVLPLMMVMAVLDLAFQKTQFAKDQKMTKEEVKREMKDMFGDPNIKGERSNIRREMNENDVRTRLKTARLVIVDIGIAIALHYEQGETPLPVVVAIGKAGMARKMVEIAQVEDVPVFTDRGLAEDLLEEGKIDQFIPATTIDRVANAMRKTNG
ncbi:MAG: Type III secretion system protein [uncultured Thiotrichaceae bacterium]|uniref:Type III secretion system protein n=1 Tax=uncultured Thiotrichaceae bacterium TaxID=298394 RepID=A0A6S6RZW2_9GAMM|nr:MAG: Type III secretion system protein [uncultured Thiotrichaceae bacterium]